MKFEMKVKIMQPIKFIHMADTHLGNQQYNLPERKRDFNKAFNWVLKKSITEEVDFILLAGDVFNSNNSEPETIAAIYQMISQFKTNSLKSLKREIPIIAIEGNHDKSNISTERSWLQFLAELELIILLSPKTNNKEKYTNFNFVPYSENKKNPGMIRIKDTCIYGIPSYGAMTKTYFPDIYNALPDSSDTFNILMMHFGISGQVLNKLGIEMSEDLKLLHEKVNYLALGHFHKKYALPKNKEWVFNPGSLEVTDAREIWGIKGERYLRGIFLVEVKNKKNPKIRHIPCTNGKTESSDEIPNRYFADVQIDIGKNDSSSFEDAILFILDDIKRRTDLEKKGTIHLKKTDLELPIVLLTLNGTISYSRLEVNINKLKESIKEKFDVLDVRVFSGSVKSEIDGIVVDLSSEKSLEEIEKDVFLQLIEQNPDYEPHKKEIIQLMLDLKSSILDPKKNFDELRNQIKLWWRSYISLSQGDKNDD